MKKILFLFAALTVVCFSSFAQNVVNPNIETNESLGTIITKIETDKQYTVISFEQYAIRDSAWVVLNKEIYIQTDIDNKHYDFVKAEGIAVAPETRHTFAKAGDKIAFKVYFKKIPVNAKAIDIIEHAGKRSDGITFFNFYNVDLTKSHPGEQRVKITEVVLAPPPVNDPEGSSTPISVDTNELTGMMSTIGPMYNGLVKSMMDAQLAFYKQPGKLAEIAKLNKQYFDALVKEGFTYEQALKIITSDSLLPKAASMGK
ncbi:hypothetical protein IDJ77_18515 [Mucilaginibacter sp. ZT4R22]|uniref:Uncharacterized protein n=1 Tax=Mucilaginibacter pankratovii TaxID=2772110 RepID=A0ABR7WU28_9SPHI|nr:hypothetical protein [Mucilaginibacter pankratovii]MBD1365816.1 hypothetical protein [Mucilaginibacter pankratovii]